MRKLLSEGIFFIILLILAVLYAINGTIKGSLDNFLNSTMDKVVANDSIGYYLSSDGTLFCPQYNTDAGEYAPINSNRIVMKDVIKFGYDFAINKYDELYIWGNKQIYKNIPNFKSKRKTNLIAKNVDKALCNGNYVAYIDKSNSLWVIGAVYGNYYEKFTKIKDNVKEIICMSGDLGYIDKYGDLYRNNEILFQGMNLKEAQFVDEQITLLTENNELYFCGKLTDQRINNKFSGNENVLLDISKDEPLKLKDNIVKLSTDSNIISAMDTEGNVYIWGYFYSNGDENYTTKEVKDFWDYKVGKGIKDFHTNFDSIVMIDRTGRPFSYGSNYALSGIGNSEGESKYFIGLNASKPIRWR